MAADLVERMVKGVLFVEERFRLKVGVGEGARLGVELGGRNAQIASGVAVLKVDEGDADSGSWVLAAFAAPAGLEAASKSSLREEEVVTQDVGLDAGCRLST
jgi:hypothetical protein